MAQRNRVFNPDETMTFAQAQKLLTPFLPKKADRAALLSAGEPYDPTNEGEMSHLFPLMRRCDLATFLLRSIGQREPDYPIHPLIARHIVREYAPDYVLTARASAYVTEAAAAAAPAPTPAPVEEKPIAPAKKPSVSKPKAKTPVAKPAVKPSAKKAKR